MAKIHLILDGTEDIWRQKINMKFPVFYKDNLTLHDKHSDQQSD